MAGAETVRGGVRLHPFGDHGIVMAWDELARTTGASPFLRPGWFHAWAQAFGGDVEVAACEDGSAFFPVVRHSGALCSPVNEHTPEAGCVALSSDARRDLFAGLLEGHGSIFRFFKVGSDEADDLEAASGGRRVLRKVTQRSPYLDLSGTWEDYERSLSTNFRQGLRRKARRLGDGGEVTVVRESGTRDLSPLLQDGFAVEGSGWKSREGTAITSRAETTAFYEAVSKWASENDWLRLWFLKVAGTTIAFRLDLEVGRTYLHLKGGYDPAHARFSPGQLLQRASLEYAFERGLARYEFLGADEDHKLKWTKTVHERSAVQIFGRGARASVGWLDQAIARPAAKRVLRRARA